MVRRLDFGAAWTVIVTECGLRFVLLADAYKIWVRLLYLLVEIENALQLDFGIQHSVTTGQEPPTQYSPYTLRLVLESRQRFSANYLRGLSGAPLQELWTIACGLGGPGEDVDWLRKVLATIVQSEATQAVDHVAAALVARLQDAMDAENVSRSVAAARVLELADLSFLSDLKLIMRDGVRIFETYKRDTATHAGVGLLDVCRRVADLYAAFYTRMLVALRPYATVPAAAEHATTADPIYISNSLR